MRAGCVPGDGLLYGFGPPARVWSLDRRPDVCAKALEIELEFTGVEMADRIADGAVGRRGGVGLVHAVWDVSPAGSHCQPELGDGPAELAVSACRGLDLDP
jgi:hypothetical protein